jgi:hypothetical protein
LLVSVGGWWRLRPQICACSSSGGHTYAPPFLARAPGTASAAGAAVVRTEPDARAGGHCRSPPPRAGPAWHSVRYAVDGCIFWAAAPVQTVVPAAGLVFFFPAHERLHACTQHSPHSHTWSLSPRLCVYACVRVCVCVRACVCVRLSQAAGVAARRRQRGRSPTVGSVPRRARRARRRRGRARPLKPSQHQASLIITHFW